MTRRTEKGRVLPGTMRQRIRLEQPSLAPDGLGGWHRSWVEVASVWAHIRAGSGDERMEAGQLAAPATYRIRLRWREDITSDMRIVFGARIFAIRGVLDADARKRFIELIAEEGAGS